MSTSENPRRMPKSGVVARGVSPAPSPSPPRYRAGSNLSFEISSPEGLTYDDIPAIQEEHKKKMAAEAMNSVEATSGVPAASAEKPPRKKPGRKPGSVNKPKPNADSSATNTDAPRKRTRKPKDPNAPVVRRKRKTDPSVTSGIGSGPEGPSMASAPRQSLPDNAGFVVPSSAATLGSSQLGKSEDIQRPPQSFFSNPPPPPQPQPVRTSGQNYDPIRSNYDPVRETIVSHNNPFSNSQGSPGHPLNRASASPSISSLVDPPNQALTSPSIAAQSFFNQQQHSRLQREEARTSLPPSPNVNRLASVVVQSSPAPAAMSVKRPDIGAPPVSGPSTISKKHMEKTVSTANSSAAPSPKPPKSKEPKDKDLYPTPPPLPGSGGQLGGQDGTEFRAPTIILNIPLNGETNKFVNFTRMAEERYGWDALHPRLAAQRDRLARVAAAGAALERNGSSKDSGDEMSLDSGDEGSNVEMGGMSDGRTGTDGGVKKKPVKRRMKEDEYDKDDGFVDDTELLWEEQAAAVSDGFFVYSGPLVPEEAKTDHHRGESAPKRGRGRGSRGGRGGTTRGGAAATLAAGAAGINPRNGLPLSGPGSRGGSTTRKPRITKADRARMEQEKLDRERMGSMATLPSNYGGIGSGAQMVGGPGMGNTPMVFNS